MQWNLAPLAYILIPMQYPSLPAGAFLAAALVLVPLPWHWQARNIGTLSIIAWLFVVNMIYAINAIVWDANVNNPAPIWCDISELQNSLLMLSRQTDIYLATKLIIGANTALPLATMCVCKHLALVSSKRVARLDHDDKRRRMIFDAVICFGIPLIFMALRKFLGSIFARLNSPHGTTDYIVQGHRYDIVENFGCQPATYFSVEGIIIVLLPPLVLATATLVYAGKLFWQRIGVQCC